MMTDNSNKFDAGYYEYEQFYVSMFGEHPSWLIRLSYMMSINYDNEELYEKYYRDLYNNLVAFYSNRMN